ncbi:MAG: extracellular solute-binding protein [Oligoflexus sp.]
MFWKTALISLGLLLTQMSLANNLPKNLKWETTSDYPLIASPDAKPGGTLNDYMMSYPLTLRQVGPDANGAFRVYLTENQLALLAMQPNTEQWIPVLATHWAFSDDGKTVYYRLNPEARWSDGKAVTADDFVFMREFMTSPHIVDPWYNQYYGTEIADLKAYKEEDGKEVVAITLPSPKPDMLYYTNLSPLPRHFYKLDENFVQKYNWEIAPVTGPYLISEIRKGRSVSFSKVKDWWAKDHPWFKNRFNVDKVNFRVIRDPNVAFENLKNAKIDYMAIPFPDYWHEKTRDRMFDNGYIHRLQAYNDAPRSDYVLILNKNYELFQDKNVREAFHYAMNIDRVIDKVLRGDYNRLQGISQGYGKYTNPKIKARPFDLKKADELLNKSGWVERNAQGIRVKDGKPLVATISYGQSNMAPRLVVLREEAKKAGIDLRLNQMDQSALWNSFLEKRHEIAFVSWSTRYRPDYWGQFHSDNANKPQNNNFSNTAIPELDKLIDQYRASTKEDERIRLAHQIQQIIHDDATQIPLFEVPYYRLAYWGWIRFPKPPGTKLTDGFQIFDYNMGGLFWIDQDAHKNLNKARRGGPKMEPVLVIDETFKPKK